MGEERRRHNRMGLSLPLRVQGYLTDGTTWDEISTTVDVSAAGACFPLKRPVLLGQVLRLTMAMPKRLRQFDLNDSNYHVFTLVRGVYRRNHEPLVGVMFFGKYPPRGFHEQPGTRYLLPEDSIASAPVPHGLRDAGAAAPGATAPHSAPHSAPPPASVGVSHAPASVGVSRAAAGEPALGSSPASGAEFAVSRGDRRGGPRVEVFVNFTLKQVDASGAVLQEELTVADNISRGGARVMTALGFHVGDVVVLREAAGEFETHAEIRAITRVQPSVDRLHLRFMAEAPERLLRL